MPEVSRQTGGSEVLTLYGAAVHDSGYLGQISCGYTQVNSPEAILGASDSSGAQLVMNACGTGVHVYLTVDLGTVLSLDGTQNGGVVGMSFMKENGARSTIYLDVSEDNQTWVNVAGSFVTSSTLPWTTVTGLYAGNVRYLRVHVEKNTFNCYCPETQPGLAPNQRYQVDAVWATGKPLSILNRTTLTNNPPKNGSSDPRECKINACNGTQASTGDPINTRTGSFDYSVVDLAIDTPAGPLSSQRMYVSEATDIYSPTLGTTCLGPGWTHNQDIRLIFPDDPGGESGVVWFKAQSANQYQFWINPDQVSYRPYPGVLAALVRKPDGSYQLTASDQSFYTFFQDGKIQSWTDAQGRRFEYSYDNPDHDHLARVSDTSGQTFIEFFYDPGYPDRLSSVRDHAGREVSFEYDAAGDLTSAVDIADQTWTYAYTSAGDPENPPHLLTQITDPRGIPVERTEYEQGRAVRQYDGLDNLVVELIYHPDGSTTIRDSQGITTTHLYSGRHLITGQEGALGSSLTQSYDGNFRPATLTDALDHTTELTWGAGGANLLEVVDSAGYTSTMTYDSLNQLTSVTDPAGYQTTYDYSGALLIQSTDALLNTTLYTYTTSADGVPAGLLKAVEDPLGNVTSYTYNALGLRTGMSDALGQATTYTYDELRRPKTVTFQGQTNWSCYDAGGRVVRAVVNASGDGSSPQSDPCDAGSYLPSADPTFDRISQTIYDAVGNPIASIDPAGRVDRTYYDDANRPVYSVQNLQDWDLYAADPPPTNLQTAEANLTTQRVYDEAGNLIASIDPSGSVTRTYYDDLKRPEYIVQNLKEWDINADGLPPVELRTDEQNVVSQNIYDANGNVIATVDPLGKLTRTYYDELNRPVFEVRNLKNWDVYAPAPPAVDLRTGDENVTTEIMYDLRGNLIATLDPLGRISRTYYDALNRPFLVVQNLDLAWGIETETPPTCNRDETGAQEPYNICTETVYDANGNPIAVIDPLGKVTRTYYDALNRPVLAIQNLDPGWGIETETPPTCNRDQTGTLEPYNVCTETVYDLKGNPIAWIDPLGRVNRTYYDALNRPIAEVGNLVGDLQASQWPAFDSAFPDQNVRTEMIYDGQGNQMAILQVLAEDHKITTRTYYDALGRSTTDVENFVGDLFTAQTPAYDPAYPDRNLATEYTYDGMGNQVSLKDADGVVTRFEYDALNRLAAVVENYRPGVAPDQETNVRTEYVYDANGNRLAIRDANAVFSGRQDFTVFEYDGLDRLKRESDPLNHTIHYAYDAAGQWVSQTDANGEVTAFEYDDLGRLTCVDYPAPDADVIFRYDVAGRRTLMQDGIGQTIWSYDGLDRTLSVTDPFSATVGYRYDALGNRVGMLYPDGGTAAYDYDALGRLSQASGLGLADTTYIYDTLGRLVTATLPNGIHSSYEYDDANRLTSLTHAITGGQILSSFGYTYNGVGNITQAIETTTHISSNADLSNLDVRVVGRIQPALNPPFSPDILNYQTMVVPSATFITITPTVSDTNATVTVNGVSVASGTPTPIPLSPGPNTVYVLVTSQDLTTVKTYTIEVIKLATPANVAPSNGQDQSLIAQTTAPNNMAAMTADSSTPDPTTALETSLSLWGHTVNFVKNLFGPHYALAPVSSESAKLQIISLSQGTRKQDAASKAFELLTSGDPQTIQIDYQYDPLNRLKEADYSDGGYFHYTYDQVGNRLSETTLNSTKTYVYDEVSRLTSVNGIAYTWDNNGNLLNDGSQTYAYTNNKLSSITGTNLNVTFQYNGLGNRVSQTVNGVTTNYLLDQAAGLTQVLQDETNTYLYGNGRIAQNTGAATEYFLTDGLGSVRQLADSTRAITLAKSYQPYGVELSHTGSGYSSYGFAGELTDPTGLIYLRARYYEPSQGRFLTRDTWPGDYTRPLSLNGWMYVEGNPVNRVDPSGRCYGPLSFLRNIPIESGICEHMDQAMFIYAWPGSTASQRNLAATYIGGWAFSHSALIVGAGGLSVAGGKAAILWLYGLYTSSSFAQQVGQTCQNVQNLIASWRPPQQTTQLTIDFLENQMGRVNHIMAEKHAWNMIAPNLTGNVLNDYRTIQPILRQVMNTTGQPAPYSSNPLGPVLQFVSTINGHQVFVIAVKISDRVLQITDAWVKTR